MSAMACAHTDNYSVDVNPYVAPANLKETDLTGVWQAQYSGGAEVDTLTVKDDGTYQQVYTTTWGYQFQSDWNPWRLEKRPSGCAYLHLQGMRFYVDGIETAETAPSSGGLSLLESCENQRLRIGPEMILTVVSAPNLGFSTAIVLAQLKSDADNNTKFFWHTP